MLPEERSVSAFTAFKLELGLVASSMNGRRIPIIPRGNEPRLHPEEATEAFREISETLERAFNTKHESQDTRARRINWSSIKTCLRTLKRYFHELRLFWKTMYSLFEYIEELQDPVHSPIVADVLYFVVYESYYAYFMLPLKDLPRIPSVLCDGYKQGLHNVVLKLMRQPYRVYRSVIIPEVDLIWSSVMMDSEKLLPILLRQGVVYIPPSSHIKGWEYCIGVLHNLCHVENVSQRFDLRSLVSNMEAQNAVVRQRIFTVFRAMDVVQHALHRLVHYRIGWEGETLGNYHERYCMVFDTIPEPIVTLQEVRHILERLFDPIHSGVVNNFCAKFANYMPESVAPITPRPLKHLSRCQIREILRVKGVFPYGVYKMPIPNALKKYLLLENWYSADSVKSENEKLLFPDWMGHHQASLLASFPPNFARSNPILAEFGFQEYSDEDDQFPIPPEY